MSKLVLLFAMLLFVILFSLCSAAQHQNPPKCPKGYQPYGERCVTQRMADYISCIEASGANHQEVTEEVNQAASKQVSGEAKGAGSGVVVKGSGSLALNANSEKEIVKKLQQKWYSDAMKHCANVLEPPRKKPVPAGTKGSAKESATATPQHPGTADLATATPQYHGTTEVAVATKSTPAQPSSTQAAQPPVTQHCEGGSCAISVGQQGGITAGTVNIGTPQRLIAKDSEAAVISILQERKGTVAIQYAAVGDEPYKFAKNVAQVFKASGWTVADFRPMMLTAEALPGMRIEYHVDTEDDHPANERIEVKNELATVVITALLTAKLHCCFVHPTQSQADGSVTLLVSTND